MSDQKKKDIPYEISRTVSGLRDLKYSQLFEFSRMVALIFSKEDRDEVPAEEVHRMASAILDSADSLEENCTEE